MKKLLKLMAILLFAAGAVACNDNMSEKSQFAKIPAWSNVIAYMTLLNQQKCMDNITVLNEEYTLEVARRESSIIGTWKLLLDFSTGDTINYTCDNVLYAFGADSTVKVTSNVNAIKSGTFKYDYYLDPYCPLCDIINPRPNLVTGNEEYYCQIARSWMILYAVEYCDIGEIKITRGKAERILCKIK